MTDRADMDEADAAMLVSVHGACNAEVDRLRALVKELERQLAEHRCALPPSIQDALNSGDGTYRP